MLSNLSLWFRPIKFTYILQVVGWGLSLFPKVLVTSTMWVGPLICMYHHQIYLNNPIFSNMGLCVACWGHFMCHHELWPTSMSHPFSSLNSTLGLAGGKSWWRHQMEAFSVLPVLCAGNSAVPGEFPVQRLVTQSFDVFFHLILKKWWNKQSRHRWFEMLSQSLWCYCNVYQVITLPNI